MIDALEKATQDRIAREEYVELEGIEKGLQKGLEKGLQKGREEAKFETAINMIRLLHTSVREAITVTNLPEELRDQLILELERQKIPYTLT